MNDRLTYEDLALKIEPAASGTELQVRVLRSPAGPCAPATFRPPFEFDSPIEVLRTLEASVWRSGLHDPTRTLTSRPPGPTAGLTPTEVGRRLLDSLFTGPVRENLVACLALIQGLADRGLRIRLVLDASLTSPLSVWPWELLYRGETRDFFSRSVRTPLVRELEVARPFLTPTPISSLRILAVLSLPESVTPLQVDAEKVRIEKALGAVPGVDLRFLEEATIENLRHRLRSEPFDVLHFVGHGELEAGQGTVVFENADGGPQPVSGTVLAETLKGIHQVRLVVLNACETACLPRDVEGHDPYLGVSSALLLAGIPAVVAMQFPITDRAALSFSGTFYRSLAQGDPLEGAITEGRMAILHAQPDSWEWATPILFLGTPHGQLFTLARPETRTPPSPPPPAASGGSAVEAALDLLEKLRYEKALAALSQAAAAAPADAAVPYYLALARLQGARPRSARLDVVKKIEADLETAIDLAQGTPGAHVHYLQALIKHDFYRFKGMAIRPPTIDELLVEAKAAPADPSELERLLAHVPTPPSPVRDAVEDRLRELVGG